MNIRLSNYQKLHELFLTFVIWWIGMPKLQGMTQGRYRWFHQVPTRKRCPIRIFHPKRTDENSYNSIPVTKVKNNYWWYIKLKTVNVFQYLNI